MRGLLFTGERRCAVCCSSRHPATGRSGRGLARLAVPGLAAIGGLAQADVGHEDGFSLPGSTQIRPNHHWYSLALLACPAVWNVSPPSLETKKPLSYLMY
jgi:hypothetical protein